MIGTEGPTPQTGKASQSCSNTRPVAALREPSTMAETVRPVCLARDSGVEAWSGQHFFKGNDKALIGHDDQSGALEFSRRASATSTLLIHRRDPPPNIDARPSGN